MTITRTENLRRILSGAEPAWVPFAPNFAQWFAHHKAHDTLPTVLANCKDHIDAHLVLGNDIFTRNIDGGTRTIDSLCPANIDIVASELGQRKMTTYNTPYGSLRQVDQEQKAITTSHTEEYLVKDWEQDGPAFRWWLAQRKMEWKEEVFVSLADRVGDAGIAILPMGCTPLKMLHNTFGLDGSCLFISDYPDIAKELCDMFWAELKPLIIRAAAHPRVEVVILMDNIDTPFYPPFLAERYWAPYVAEASAIMRSAGKYLFVHACGKLAALAPFFASTQVSGLEGISHAPLGDWTPAAAVACHERFIYFGGFSPMEQRLSDANITRFYQDFLSRTPKQRVIIGASCNVEITTPLDRILQVRQFVRDWGGSPG